MCQWVSGSVGHVDQLQKVLAANTEILDWPCWEVSEEALASRRVPMNKSNNLRKEDGIGTKSISS
jgi:hypothetical protein